MQARTSILAAGLTSALLLLVYPWMERQPAPGPGLVPPRAGEARSRDEPELRVAPSTAPRVQGSRTAIAAERPTTEEQVELEIVRADTHTPVAEAMLWWWPDPAAAEDGAGLQSWLRLGQIEAHLPEARLLRADPRGRLQVPAQGEFSVVAASGGLWGCASFPAELAGPAVVTLAPDADLRVRVRTPAGAPVAGVRVVLRQSRGTASFDRLVVPSEAPEGLALLRHAAHVLRAVPGEDFVVALAGLLDPPVERPVEREHLSGEPLELVLVPSGSCAVEVVDESGQPVPGPLTATLAFADVGPRSPSETRRSETGEEVLFEPVSLGRTLLVRVMREGSARPLEARGPGPTRAGERVRIALCTGADVAVLSGRLVDPSGAPAADRAVRVQLESLDAGASLDLTWARRTAADGRFTIDTALPPSEGPVSQLPARASLAVYVLSEQGAPLAVARRSLPSELRAGAHELGDFAPLELPVAAAGIVVDPEGKGLAEVTVTASVPRGSHAGDEQSGADFPALDPCRSDAEGRFEIRGEVAAARLALTASRSGRAGEPLLVARGQRDVRLVLGSGGTLAGQVLLDPSLLPELVLVQVVRRDGVGGAETVDRHGVLAPDGRFELAGLRPGVCTLRVVFAPTATELATVEDLRVGANDVARDTRIAPLDLRSSFRLLELELIDELERPVTGARAFSRPSLEPEAKWAYGRAEGGRLWLLSDGRPLDVAISASGFSAVELPGVAASRRVVLPPAARLYLYLAKGLRLPEPPCYLGVQLTPVELAGFAGSTDSGVRWFEPGGTLACRSGFTGRMRVELVLERRDGRGEPLVVLEEDAPQVLTVADHSLEQALEITFAPERLRAALERLRGEQ